MFRTTFYHQSQPIIVIIVISNLKYSLYYDIQKLQEQDDLDIEALTDDFVTFFLAGQETTANALAFCFLEMNRNPEILMKAREEIDRVLGERDEVTYQDVNELKYCTAVFKETLRLYPPAANVIRRVPEDMHINEFKIPKDTKLWVANLYLCFTVQNYKNTNLLY